MSLIRKLVRPIIRDTGFIDQPYIRNLGGGAQAPGNFLQGNHEANTSLNNFSYLQLPVAGLTGIANDQANGTISFWVYIDDVAGLDVEATTSQVFSTSEDSSRPQTFYTSAGTDTFTSRIYSVLNTLEANGQSAAQATGSRLIHIQLSWSQPSVLSNVYFDGTEANATDMADGLKVNDTNITFLAYETATNSFFGAARGFSIGEFVWMPNYLATTAPFRNNATTAVSPGGTEAEPTFAGTRPLLYYRTAEDFLTNNNRGTAGGTISVASRGTPGISLSAADALASGLNFT